MTVGSILKRAREAQHLSQLELALRIDISQRHLSFVESGRARPSRDLILSWMAELAAPESLRNAALLQAGFSVSTETSQRGKPSAEPPADVHDRVLDAHDPWPGLIFNADWRMLRLNAGACKLFGWIMPEFLDSLKGELTAWDMIAGIAHDGGLLSRMPEPWIIGGRLLGQLRIESLMRPVLTARVEALEQALRTRYGTRLDTSNGKALVPGLNLCFETPLGRLNFFTVQGVFKLPQDVAPAIVRTGLWYPDDLHTQKVMRAHVPTA